MKPRITLEQWQALLAVVNAGGYAQAAEQLNKSQSAVSYAIQKMESLLNLQIFELSGRKSVLTPAGKALYLRAEALVEEASMTEQMASQFSAGMQAEVRIAIDTITPAQMVMRALAAFAQEAPLIRIQVVETVLSGSDEAVNSRSVDLAILGLMTGNVLKSPLMQIRMLAVAHPDHPLHQLNHPITTADLKKHRQLVIRDSGSQDIDAGWLKADQRWTFSNLDSSVRAATMGLGYSWYPEANIEHELTSGQLAPLCLEEGSSRYVHLSIAYPNGEFSGPAVRRLGELISAQAREEYPEQSQAQEHRFALPQK